MKTKYRIIKSDGRIKFAGTDSPSWLSLEDAKKYVDYSTGESIYEYNKDNEKLWEIL